MKSHKCIAAVLSAAMLLCLTACGAKDNTNSTASLISSEQTSDTSSSLVSSDSTTTQSTDTNSNNAADTDTSSTSSKTASKTESKKTASSVSSKAAASKNVSSNINSSAVRSSSNQNVSSKNNDESNVINNIDSSPNGNNSSEVTAEVETSIANVEGNDYSSVQVDTTSDGPADPLEWYEAHGMDPNTVYHVVENDYPLLDRDSFPDEVKPYVYPYDAEGIRQDMIDYAVQTYGLVLDESITLFDSTWSEGPDSEAWHAKRDPEYFRAACLEDVDYAVEKLCMGEEDTSWINGSPFNIVVNPMVSGIEGGCYIGIDQFPDEVVVYVLT